MSQPYLELLFYRAPDPLNWTTPRDLILSTLRNRFHWVQKRLYPHSISHVNVILKTSSGEIYSRGMALSSSPFGYLYRFFVKGSSLDTLLINLPGRFMTETEIHGPLETFRRAGYVETLKILLSHDQADRAELYLNLYQKYGQDQIYGALASDPLKGQGAGCSAFAVSVLEVLGLVTEEFKNSWQRELRIPLSLMTTSSKRATIGFIGFLLGKNSAWVPEKSPHYRLQFWDPERMHQWSMQIKKSDKLSDFYLDKQSNTLIWDAQLKPLPELDLANHFEGLSNEVQKELSTLGHLWSEEKLRRLLIE